MNDEYVIASYLRISDDDGRYGDSQSISVQRELLNNFIHSHTDLKKARHIEFVDDGYSGTNFNRPGVKELLEKVKKGYINCIIVKDFSRFGRNFIDVGDYLEQIFPFLQIRFISVTDGFDSDNIDCSAADISVSFKNLCNDYYCKDLSRKVKSGIITLWNEGKHYSSLCPYGYKKLENEPYSFVVDEKAAEIVRRIFNMKLSGMSCKVIAQVLNSEGVLSPLMYKDEQGIKCGRKTTATKTVWTDKTVYAIIKDISYTGVLAQGKYRIEVVGSRKKRKVPKEQWYYTPDHHEAIISKEDFEKAQPTTSSSSFTKKLIKTVNPLAGKIRCGGCGYCLRKNGSSNESYYCSHKTFEANNLCLQHGVAVTIIEDTLLAAIQKLFAIIPIEEKSIKELEKSYISPSMNFLSEIRFIQKQINQLDNAKVSLYQRYSEEEISKDEYLAKRSDYEVRIGELTTQLSVLENNNSQLKETFMPTSSNQLYEDLKNLQFDGQLTHEIVDTFIKQVNVFSKDRIEIIWTFADIFKN